MSKPIDFEAARQRLERDFLDTVSIEISPQATRRPTLLEKLTMDEVNISEFIHIAFEESKE